MKKSLKTLLVFSSLFIATGIVTACGNSGASSSQTSQDNRAYSGIGVPPNTLGIDGDTYTDTETGNMYRKENGQWVLVTNANPQHYSGEGAPSDDLGVNGDTYTDTINGAVYEKQNGHWVCTRPGDTVYTITFNLNGGHFADGSTTYPDQTVREGRWITAPTSDPIKEHCTFLGWYANGSTTAWNFVGQSVYGNVDLVAKWNVNEEDKLTITIDPNNGEATYTYETFVGDYYYPSIPSKEGYSFTGWYVMPDNTKYGGYVTADLAGKTLQAQWEKAKFNVVYQIEANDEVTITGIIDIETVSITIPNVINGRKVTKISSKAFNSRIYLTSVNIPENVKVIEPGAFRGTWRLVEINVDSNNLYYTSKNGVLYSKNFETLECYPTKAGASFTCPATLKKIGAYAFYETRDSGLSSIIFNEGLVEIGAYAFTRNETIQTITFPSTLKKIGAGAFMGSTVADDEGSYISPQGVLTNSSFNEGLEEIGEMAFANQYFKETFTLPSTVKTIGDYAFANCNAIEKLIIPSGLENFGRNVFAGATGILDLEVASGNTHFKAIDGIMYTYDGTKVVMCPSGRTEPVTIPEGVTELCDFAFYMVDECQEYTFPATLKRIGEECFAHTYGLKSFVIPNSVTELGENCFDLSGIKSVTIGTGLTEIPSEAFIETGLTSVAIPGNVKTIGAGAFSLCSSLTTLTLEEGVETIGRGAFSSAKISALSMPNSLKEIGVTAFNGSSIKSLDVKKGLESIGDRAFSSSDGATTISSITVDSENPNFSTSDNILYSKDGKTLYFASNKAGEADGTNYTVTIKNGVTRINDYAFSYAKNITQMNLPSTLESIGDGAFMYTKFKTLTLPTSLKTIGDGAFYFSYMTSITFSEGLESIGESAFAMSDITAAILPNSLKTVGITAFSRCLSLTNVKLGTGLEEIKDYAFSDNKINTTIEIPASCTKIGNGAFSSTVSTYGQSIANFVVDPANPNYSTDGTLLMDKNQTTVYALKGSATSVSIPNTVKVIAPFGMAANQFKGTSLSLPSSLETIGEAGLAFLMKVATLNVPASVSYIGRTAFAYWGQSQAINFNCTRDYTLTNFDTYFLSGCSATVTYQG